jgi:hypothetical protein
MKPFWDTRDRSQRPCITARLTMSCTRHDGRGHAAPGSPAPGLRTARIARWLDGAGTAGTRPTSPSQPGRRHELARHGRHFHVSHQLGAPHLVRTAQGTVCRSARDTPAPFAVRRRRLCRPRRRGEGVPAVRVESDREALWQAVNDGSSPDRFDHALTRLRTRRLFQSAPAGWWRSRPWHLTIDRMRRRSRPRPELVLSEARPACTGVSARASSPRTPT